MSMLRSSRREKPSDLAPGLFTKAVARASRLWLEKTGKMPVLIQSSDLPDYFDNAHPLLA